MEAEPAAGAEPASGAGAAPHPHALSPLHAPLPADSGAEDDGADGHSSGDAAGGGEEQGEVGACAASPAHSAAAAGDCGATSGPGPALDLPCLAAAGYELAAVVQGETIGEVRAQGAGAAGCGLRGCVLAAKGQVELRGLPSPPAVRLPVTHSSLASSPQSPPGRRCCPAPTTAPTTCWRRWVPPRRQRWRAATCRPRWASACWPPTRRACTATRTWRERAALPRVAKPTKPTNWHAAGQQSPFAPREPHSALRSISSLF